MPGLRAEVDAHPVWYHTIELAPGVVTPGWMDLRDVVARMPWPDVRGKRCLDVGTYDGFLAFELERRGASEVVATDIADHTQWDWSLSERRSGPEYLRTIAGPEKGRGFEIARAALGSSVEKREISVYDLTPDAVGEFDFVVCGSLLLHLQNPVRALEAIRSVCRGTFLSAEQIDPWLSLLSPGRPATWFRAGNVTQWFVPNRRGHRALVECAGFTVERQTRPYSIALGAGHPSAGHDARTVLNQAAIRLVTGGRGVPHCAVLARAT